MAEACCFPKKTPRGKGTRNSSAAVRLLIFGDSWARSDDPDITPWPELLGQQMNWRTLNAAVPGSTSDEMWRQLDSLKVYLDQEGVMLHEEVWAVVHAGGNDLLEEVFNNTIGFSLEALARTFLCCSWRFCPLRLLRHIAKNLEEFASQLHRGFGVKNIAFVGLPLTPTIPSVDMLVQALKDDLPYIAPVIPRILRQLITSHDAMLGRGLRRLRRQIGAERTLFTTVLDEATAIDAVCAPRPDIDSPPQLFLEDGLHLTREGHELLLKEFLLQMPSSLHRAKATGVLYPCVWLDEYMMSDDMGNSYEELVESDAEA